MSDLSAEKRAARATMLMGQARSALTTTLKSRARYRAIANHYRKHLDAALTTLEASIELQIDPVTAARHSIAELRKAAELVGDLAWEDEPIERYEKP